MGRLVEYREDGVYPVTVRKVGDPEKTVAEVARATEEFQPPWLWDPDRIKAKLASKRGWRPEDFPLPRAAFLAHKKAGGRIDSHVIASLVNALSKGISLRGACAVLGISLETVASWRMRARSDPPEEPYLSAVTALEFARGLIEGRAVEAWVGAFDKDWRAAQSYLATTQPREYGPPVSRVELESNTRTTVSHVMDAKQLVQVANILQDAGILQPGIESVPVDAIVVDADAEGSDVHTP